MSAAAPSPVNDKVVFPALRSDLIVIRQIYEGRTYYIVKDPISLQYFRMTAEDYFLASLFDGKRLLAQLRDAYIGQFPHLRLDYLDDEINDRILRFANDLNHLQFLSTQGMRLKPRYDAAKKVKKDKGRFNAFVNNVFFFRRSVVDPDLLFERMAKPIWWIWTRTSLWISIALVAVAIVVFIRNFDRTGVAMSHFFSLNNIALMWVTTILIKSIHELGHGLTCKHFGGEVHEVGLMMLVFTPHFFVNVSDSWVMPERRHRILVSAAGIYVELVLASLATFLWAIVQPGPLQQMLYNVMVIASISTLIFNANPLMRFDGYYIMTDLIEVPNLSTKSRAFIGSRVKRLLFGKNYQDQSMSRLPLPRRRFALFYFYAIASYIYGYFVIYKLARYMAPHLKPFGLEALADWFSGAALLSWVVMPLYGFFKGLGLNRADWRPHGRLRRLALIGGGAAAVFGLLCLFPHELIIKRAVAVELANPETIRPVVAGFVSEVYVKEGQRVDPGAAIARLQNREIEEAYITSQERVRIAETLIQNAVGQDKPVDMLEGRSAQTEAEGALKEAKRNYDALVLRTVSGGIVLTTGSSATDLSRNLESKIGKMLTARDVFCEVASLDHMLIKVPLTEQQVRYVRKGQTVLLKPYAYPGKTLTGHIASDPLNFIGKDLPPALSSKREGDVQTVLVEGGAEMPLQKTLIAEIEVDNREGLLREGMTGRANIHAGRHSYGKLVFQSLLDLVSLDYRF